MMTLVFFFSGVGVEGYNKQEGGNFRYQSILEGIVDKFGMISV